MKKEFKIGGITGVAFVLVCGLIIALFLDISMSRMDAEFWPFAVLFLGFSFFFGGLAGKRISKGSWALPQGIVSTLLTTYSTIGIYVIYSFVTDPNGHSSLGDFVIGVLFGMMITLIQGGIPMLVLGCIYGFLLQKILKHKNGSK
ncbi:MAG: hypothetical protein ACFHU9_04430 [Fluviicola sp.]